MQRKEVTAYVCDFCGRLLRSRGAAQGHEVWCQCRKCKHRQATVNAPRACKRLHLTFISLWPGLDDGPQIVKRPPAQCPHRETWTATKATAEVVK